MWKWGGFHQSWRASGWPDSEARSAAQATHPGPAALKLRDSSLPGEQLQTSGLGWGRPRRQLRGTTVGCRRVPGPHTHKCSGPSAQLLLEQHRALPCCELPVGGQWPPHPESPAPALMTSWPPLGGVVQEPKDLKRHLCGRNGIGRHWGRRGLPFRLPAFPGCSLFRPLPCRWPSGRLWPRFVSRVSHAGTALGSCSLSGLLLSHAPGQRFFHCPVYK